MLKQFLNKISRITVWLNASPSGQAPPKKWSWRSIYTPMFTAALFTIAKTETQPKYTTNEHMSKWGTDQAPLIQKRRMFRWPSGTEHFKHLWSIYLRDTRPVYTNEGYSALKERKFFHMHHGWTLTISC